MSRKPNTKLNENGFASIVIALILIIVLALLTVGFAQLARREQQSALDKQLASQANYAAESGINAAYRDIKNGKITPANADKINCMQPLVADTTAATHSHNVDSNNGVQYTCLLVDLQPPNLSFGGVSAGSGRHMTFGTQDSLTRLNITWGSDSGNNKYFPPGTNTKLPAWSNWHDGAGNRYPPLIEFSITPVVDPIPPYKYDLSHQSNPTQYLIDNTFNFYLYPAAGGSNSVNFDTSNQGQIVAGDCNPTAPNPSNAPASYPCQVTLNGLGGRGYLIHFVDFYDTSNIFVTGTTPSGAAQFSGEPLIDVTGKARNVLKRLQGRLLLNGGNNGPNDNAILPNGAVEAQNICKRILAAPPTTDFPAGSTYDTGTSSSCDLSN